EDAGRNVRAARGHVDVEDRIALVGDVVERAGERGVDHRARVRDLHARPDAVWTARPTGVHEPDVRVVFGNPIAEQLRVDVRIPHHEGRAEAGAERRLGFRD